METKRQVQSLGGEPGFLCASCGSSDCRQQSRLLPASFSSLTHSAEWGSIGRGLRVGGGRAVWVAVFIHTFNFQLCSYFE